MTINTLVKTTSDLTWSPPASITPKQAGESVCAFLDAATTSFGRATHYNSREEQQLAEVVAHSDLFEMDRDLYVAFMNLPGVTDRSRQIGTKKLLGSSRDEDGRFLTPDSERAVLYKLIQSLPPQRMLKLFDALRFGNKDLGIPKANNSRTRKLILRTLLSSPRLQLWSVKYRSKVVASLTHAWGERMTGIIRSILEKDEIDAKEQGILNKRLVKFTKMDSGKTNDCALECVAFALGAREDRFTIPLFKAFIDAKKDIKRGKILPIEVLEGIRSTYHKNISKEDILKLTKDSLTKGQKLAVQKRAKTAGIKVDIDPLDYDATRLYIYAFEVGMTPEIRSALDKKAADAAARFPTSFDSVGVLVDASRSMVGDKTQPLRPMAATLALSDMLSRVGRKSIVQCSGGEVDGDLIRPSGDTDLADGLINLLEQSPEAIFVVSDGYENAPAGRFSEVVTAVRELGDETPIYHLNPVYAAESSGVRKLAVNDVPTLPASRPEAIGTAVVRGLIDQDPVQGINALLRVALATSEVETKLLI